jgi:hypothetical protein
LLCLPMSGNGMNTATWFEMQFNHS